MITIRKATSNDLVTYRKWAASNASRNHFSPSLLDTKLFDLLVAVEPDGKPVLYLPVTPVLMLESVAVRPDLSPHVQSSALRLLVAAAQLRALRAGMGELVFWASDENTAEGSRHLGFEPVGMTLYRKEV